MSDFMTLSCPSCGHKLQITPDIDRFACAACGNEHIVNRSGGIVTLKPVIDSIKRVQDGVDKTASELAIKRLQEEIKNLATKRKNEQIRWNETLLIGLVLICLAACPTLLILLARGGQLSGKLVSLVVTVIIITIVVFVGIKVKKGHDNKLDELDLLIDSKNEELRHHQNQVTRQ